MEYHFIAIEGNIGSGKTTLAHRLATHYNGKLILEQFVDNPFLAKFYEDRDRYAFPVELSFLAERYNQLKAQLLNRDLFQEIIISDYVITKSQLFARANLNEDEYDLFQRMAEIMKSNLPKPDLIIYLHAPIVKLQQQIRKRGRPYEQQIRDEYLEEIGAAYSAYLEQEKSRILHIDTTLLDSKIDEDLAQLIAFLDGGPITSQAMFLK
ncbi:deoxynucleoside kinase [Taibaiella chishuiensis]|uniref:Deoxyadenosine/deoxycytidine kinase n=1 Tax=Taibaiella chishuiensis TaxID=1434707 RepID=A0A2P8DBR8_9BACT|nr:deoxynucleoside kinase [Taibaiella chishuiensis]PSK94659.1 deoxyadenosine/deoxycytidine kinase [Taibaiella chishuiensis]